MTNPVVIDSVAHANTRIDTTRCAKLGDNIQSIGVFPREFRRLLAHYPIFVTKDPQSGKFGFAVLLGFEPGENLFLNDDRWEAGYVPLQIQRHPFLVGRQGAGADASMLISIDMDSPRVQEDDGEALFQADGKPSKFLETMNSVLAEILRGIDEAEAFANELMRLDLLESVSMDVQLKNGQKYRVDGLYTVQEGRLQALSGDALGQFHASGHLQLAHLMLGSLAHLSTLIEKKNARQQAAS